MSIASVAVLTAVSNPKVRWVPLTSLSIVLGTQTTGRPLRQSSCEICRLPSPPIETSASKPLAWKAATRSSERSHLVFLALSVAHDVAEGIAAIGGPQDGAAEVGDAADLSRDRAEPRR